MHAPLAGASVIITRPAGTGAAMAQRVRALGGRALMLPGLSLRPAASPATARTGLGGLGEADIAIFQSPAAVRFARILRRSLRVRRGGLVIAIGDGTRRALALAGVDAVIPERADSEGVLALPALQKLRGRRVIVIGARGGRDLIVPALRRRGAHIELVEVYQRVAPRLTQRHFAAVSGASDPLVMLISSGEALLHLAAQLPSTLLERLRAAILVVSSARLAAIAREHAFGEIVVARSALSSKLLDAASKALARHRL